MHLTHLCIALVAVLCARTDPWIGVPIAQSVQVQADHFPVPAQGLSIAAPEEGGPTLSEILDQLARVTGLNFHVSEHARQQLQQKTAGLLGPVEVPPAEVHSFVESLLWQSGFVVLDEREAKPPLLAIKALASPDIDSVRQGCITVPAERIEIYKRHPALMIQTVVELPGTDVNQLASSLRMLMTDGRTQQLLPAGEAVILVGPGRQVANLAEILRAVRDVDAATSGRRREPRANERRAVQEQEESEAEPR